MIRRALGWVQQALREDEQVLRDARSVRAVRKMSKEKLCARYNRS
ncbi:MAG: hypothetical protein WBF17_10325 [Phycisphaerae bacterium]